MNTITAITGRNLTIRNSFDEKMLGLSFNANKNIQFLPILIFQSFPKLKSISASKCSIIEISKQNFENLALLEQLYLTENMIYTIWSDTFEHLKALQALFLGKFIFQIQMQVIYFFISESNNIKFMNGQLFAPNPHLRKVFVSQNACIDKNFSLNDDAHAMRHQVTTQCGFPEPRSRKNSISCLITNCNDVKKFDCCQFKYSTAIDSRDFLVSNALNTDVLNFEINDCEAVNFLPTFVNFKFPNLQIFIADHCNISEISKMNFANLSKLREINLSFNRIDTVLKNTFEGLDLLMRIHLGQ